MEISILNWIQENLRCGFLDVVLKYITYLGEGGALWIVTALALLAMKKTRKVGLVMAVALVLEALCTDVILKRLVARTRPFDINTAVQLIVTKPGDYSFPSGHTGISFAGFGALFFAKSKLWKPALAVAALIALSRLYLYVHFPTDILGGIVVGTLAGYAGAKIVKRLPASRFLQ